jgi:hypothetical protein
MFVFNERDDRDNVSLFHFTSVSRVFRESKLLEYDPQKQQHCL